MIASYTNGNTLVSIYEDGTKERTVSGKEERLEFPESIDVKITDYCDAGCSYCHEKSTVRGLHGDLDALLNKLVDLPAGVELAIGGGNPLAHPDLYQYLSILKSKGFICNLTVNQIHIHPSSLLQTILSNDLVQGLGISILNSKDPILAEFSSREHNVVHLIAGVHRPDDMERLLLMGFKKFLLLGYKTWGRGIRYNDKFSDGIQAGIAEWYRRLPEFFGSCILSFDNLAIEQLKVRRLFTEEGWSEFYMGDDFTHSMYIDAVKQEYAPTSRSADRISWQNLNIIDFFRKSHH
jgi:hypothetical protein